MNSAVSDVNWLLANRVTQIVSGGSAVLPGDPGTA